MNKDELKHNIVTDFTNTYCEATQLHYDELIKMNDSLIRWEDDDYYSITFLPNIRHGLFHSKDAKQIHFNTDINKWLYTKRDNMMLSIEEEANELEDYIKVNDNPPAINNFKDYGFTADFEGEILSEVCGDYFGHILNVAPVKWDKDSGLCFIYNGSHNVSHSKYNLTQIKKEWFKDIPKQGTLCWFEREYKSGTFNEIELVMRYKSESNQSLVVVADGNCWFKERFIPLTNEEIDSFKKDK